MKKLRNNKNGEKKQLFITIDWKTNKKIFKKNIYLLFLITCILARKKNYKNISWLVISMLKTIKHVLHISLVVNISKPDLRTSQVINSWRKETVKFGHQGSFQFANAISYFKHCDCLPLSDLWKRWSQLWTKYTYTSDKEVSEKLSWNNGHLSWEWKYDFRGKNISDSGQ